MKEKQYTITELTAEIRAQGTAKKAATSAWFFKTGKGEYAEGDKFIGVTVPELRKIAKRYRDVSVSQATQLLKSPWHEDRLVALYLLVQAFNRGDAHTRKSVYDTYLLHTRYINNWDLVDASAEYIVGAYLQGRSIAPLCTLAKSSLLWERRIAMVATHYAIRRGSSAEALCIAELLVYDTEDLIHKAVGWMLREVGKQCSRAEEERFLRRYASTMPRTMLRYALEHFSESERRRYMQLKK